MGAITFSRLQVLSSLEFLGGNPRNRKRMQTASRSSLTIRTGRPMRPARAPPTRRRNPAKRKRILYRRFLVSLGERSRNPTRPSLSRRKELHPDPNQRHVYREHPHPPP